MGWRRQKKYCLAALVRPIEVMAMLKSAVMAWRQIIVVRYAAALHKALPVATFTKTGTCNLALTAMLMASAAHHRLLRVTAMLQWASHVRHRGSLRRFLYTLGRSYFMHIT